MNKEKIIKKSYKIDLDKIKEGYLYHNITCHAKNLNEAKSKLLKDIKYLYLILKYSYDEPVGYINIPVIRDKDNDIVIFEGVETIRYKIPEIIFKRNRELEFNRIENDETIKYCYIIKGPYYRPNYCGYTSFMHEAGVYPKLDAINHARGVSEIRLGPVNIDEHNALINEEIKNLQKNIIKE